MTEDQKTAVLNARAAKLNATVAGMVAENRRRENLDHIDAYGEDDFQRAITDNGLGQNQITSLLIHNQL